MMISDLFRQTVGFTWAASSAAAERLVDTLSPSPESGEDTDEEGDAAAAANPFQRLVRGTFQAGDRIGQAAVDTVLEVVPGSDRGEGGEEAVGGSAPAELEEFRDTRNETLEIVGGLSQAELDAVPAAGGWSVGEVLDHLTRVDRLFRRGLDELYARKRDGRPPFVFRGLAESEVSIPLVPDSLLPLFDPPMAFLGVAVPRSVRQVVSRDRRVPTRAPAIIRPRAGRPADDLLAELREMPDYLRRLFDDNPDIRASELFYYDPLTGVATVPGILTFSASHESRHQEQLRELVAGADWQAEA